MDAITCQVVCEQQLSAKETNKFIEKIEQDYTIHM